MIDMFQNLLIKLGQSSILSFMLTLILVKMAYAFQWFDKDPHHLKGESRPAVASYGGVAVYLSFWISSFFSMPQMLGMARYQWLWFSSTLILVVGIVDDTIELSPLKKSLGILLAANLVYFMSGIEFSSRILPANLPWFFEFIPYLATIIWIFFVTNAINILDGLDGVASSVTLVSLVTLTLTTFFFSRSMQVILLILLVNLIGAVLGFLPHNLPSAKIYLGDTGSLFVGFMYGALSVTSLKNASLYSLLIPVIIYMLPIFDVTYAMIRRLLTGKSIAKGDREHLHHRLQQFGLKDGQVLGMMVGITMVFSLIAICSHLWPQYRWIWLVLTGSMILILMVVMKISGRKRK